MHSSYINPIFGVKFVIGNGFSDPEHFACKPTFKDTLSKLFKNRKLNYALARKSFPVALPNELVLALGKVNLPTKFDKNRTRNGSAIVDTSLKVS